MLIFKQKMCILLAEGATIAWGFPEPIWMLIKYQRTRSKLKFKCCQNEFIRKRMIILIEKAENDL